MVRSNGHKESALGGGGGGERKNGALSVADQVAASGGMILESSTVDKSLSLYPPLSAN